MTILEEFQALLDSFTEGPHAFIEIKVRALILIEN
jgi:hypothetical protein